MGKIVRALLDWISRWFTIQSLINSEIFHTWFWPLLGAVVTGASGIGGGVAIMWALVAAAITFAAITLGLLGVFALRVQNSPQNKLAVKTIFNCDLTPREAPLFGNRHQRRSALAREAPKMLSSSQIDPSANRTMDKAQLGVEITNNAFFPISCILQSAETEVEGEKPPRSEFPKKAALVRPGGSIRIQDDPIPMDEFPCQRLAGKMDIFILYGRPGAEIYELRAKGTVSIVMESFGFVGSVMTDIAGMPI